MPIEPPIADEYSRSIGLWWEAMDETRLTVTPALLNPNATLTGPIYFSMLDYTMGSTLFTALQDGETIATINIAINYVGPAREGDELTCRAVLDRRTRVNAVLRAEVTRSDGRLLATGVGSFTIYQRTG